MQRLTTLRFSLSLLVFVLLSTTGTSQSSAQTNTLNQYAAKFVCGKSDEGLAAPGQYFTIINVHNPSPNANVNFRKKFALGERDEKVGRITRFWPESLHGDEVMGIDCPNIYKHTGQPEGKFIEGFAVIESRAELDVVAVYTAGQDHVETLHTERVPSRRVANVPEVCPDLNLNISTGFGGWQIISDPISTTTEPRLAPVESIIDSFTWDIINGSKVIGPFFNSNQLPVPRGDYVYEFTFCLCSGFSNAKLELKGLAEDEATVSLNGTALSPKLLGTHTVDVKSISATGPFNVGPNNKLTVRVSNRITSITGLDIKGSITATGGACHPDD
jgi:hypothetical protein